MIGTIQLSFAQEIMEQHLTPQASIPFQADMVLLQQELAQEQSRPVTQLTQVEQIYHVTRVLEENNLVNLQLSYSFLNNLVSKIISNTEIRTQEKQIEKSIERFTKAAPMQTKTSVSEITHDTVSLVHTVEKELSAQTHIVLERAAQAQKQAERALQAHFTLQNTVVQQGAQYHFTAQQNEVNQQVQQIDLHHLQKKESVLHQTNLLQQRKMVQQNARYQMLQAAPLAARAVTHQYRTELGYLLRQQLTHRTVAMQQDAMATQAPIQHLSQFHFKHSTVQAQPMQREMLPIVQETAQLHLTHNTAVIQQTVQNTSPAIQTVEQQHLTQSTTVTQQTTQIASPAIQAVSQQHLTQNNTTVRQQALQNIPPAIQAVTQQHLVQNNTTVQQTTQEVQSVMQTVTQQHLTQNNTTMRQQTVQSVPPVIHAEQQLLQNNTVVQQQTVQNIPSAIQAVEQQLVTQNNTTVHQQIAQSTVPIIHTTAAMPMAERTTVQQIARQTQLQRIQPISLVQVQHTLQQNQRLQKNIISSQSVSSNLGETPRNAVAVVQTLPYPVTEPLLRHTKSEEEPVQPSFLSVPLVHEQPKETAVVQEETTDLLEIIQKTNKIEQTQVETQVNNKILQIQETISDLPQRVSFTGQEASQWVQPNNEQVAKIADKVYKVIEQRLRTEKSRRGMR